MLSEAKHLAADPSLHSGCQTLRCAQGDNRGDSQTLRCAQGDNARSLKMMP